MSDRLRLRIIVWAIIGSGVFPLSQTASARGAGGTPAKTAGTNFLHGTMYDVALERPGKNFHQDVRLQGTGVRQDGTVVQWTKRGLKTLPSVQVDPTIAPAIRNAAK